MSSIETPSGGKGPVRPKLGGDLESILAQGPSVAGFGDKGYRLIMLGLFFKWSADILPKLLWIIGTFICIYMYGPAASTMLLGPAAKYVKNLVP